jgi:uncharacterized protein
METNKTKLILAGGSGYLGTILAEYFKNEYREILVLSRGQERTNKNIRYANWDAEHSGAWQNELENSSVVINLTGKNVNCRYTEKNKKEILLSRVNATKLIGETIQKLKSPPHLWINLTSSTIFRHSEDKQMTEEDVNEYGNDFSVGVCKAWEESFYSFSFAKTRQVALRVGMALGNTGGVFPVLKRLVKFGLGGKMGKGNQFVSWIDDVDFLRMVRWAIENENVSGTYNCTSPIPATNKELMKTLRDKMHIPIGIPAPEFLLEIGSFIIRTETELVSKSRNVIPAKAMKEGFTFHYPNIKDSIEHILSNK